MNSMDQTPGLYVCIASPLPAELFLSSWVCSDFCNYKQINYKDRFIKEIIF